MCSSIISSSVEFVESITLLHCCSRLSRCVGSQTTSPSHFTIGSQQIGFFDFDICSQSDIAETGRVGELLLTDQVPLGIGNPLLDFGAL